MLPFDNIDMAFLMPQGLEIPSHDENFVVLSNTESSDSGDAKNMIIVEDDVEKEKDEEGKDKKLANVQKTVSKKLKTWTT